ncbi:hypothetical protein F5146DRAFT_1142224 [Armillaria mellea]|nr:hypothetical protein F5146DRAFT_1142224 [Armillaria mellea]
MDISRGGPGHDVQALADAGFGEGLVFNLDVGVPRLQISDQNYGCATPRGIQVQEGHAVASVYGNSRQLNRGYRHTCLNHSRKDGFYEEVVIWLYPALPEENGTVFRDAVAGLIADGASQFLAITQGAKMDNFLATLSISIYRNPEQPTNIFDATRDFSPSLGLQRQIDMDQGPNIPGQAQRHMDATAIATFSTQVLPADCVRSGIVKYCVEIPFGPRLPVWNYKDHWVSTIVVPVFTSMGTYGPITWRRLYPWPLDGYPLTTTGQDMPVTPPSGVGLVIDLFRNQAVDFYADVRTRPIVNAMGLS